MLVQQGHRQAEHLHCLDNDGWRRVWWVYKVAATGKEELTKDSNVFTSFELNGWYMTPQRFVVRMEFMGDARVRFNRNNRNMWFVVFDDADGS